MSGKISKLLRKFADEMGKKKRDVKSWYTNMSEPDRLKALTDIRRYINAK